MTPHEAAALVGSETGHTVRVIGALPGGEAGAHEVRWGAHGARGVLKSFAGADRAAADRSVSLAERLRARGYPIPPIVLAARRAGALVAVQGWMPGATEETVDDLLVTDVLRLNRLQRGLAEPDDGEEPWGDFVLRALRHGLSRDEGLCLHAPLQNRDGRTAALLRRIQRCADDAASSSLEAGDIAHCDFHHRNVLRDRGRVSAVVDWDSARAGDAAYDLVTLAFCSAVAQKVDDGAVERLWRRALEDRCRPVIAAYAALLALRQVDWSIRHRSEADVTTWLEASERTLDRLEAAG